MKLRTFIATLVLIALVITQARAQQQSTPKYNNDLDRAMCVYSQAHRKLTILNWSKITGQGFLIGGLFLILRENHFKDLADKKAEALLLKFVKSETQKNAFINLLDKRNYFLNEPKKNLDELKEAANLLLKIDDTELQSNMKGLDLDNAKIQPEIAYKEYEMAAAIPYNQQRTKLRLIDDWVAHYRSKVRLAINNEMVENSTGFLKTQGVTRSELLAEIKTLQSKTRRFANWSLTGLIIGMAAISIAFWMNAELADDDTVDKFASWGLPEVRNYFSKPDNQQDMRNLAAQAKGCGCY